MNIFVTGATGFIGKNLIKRLINFNCNIYANNRKLKDKIVKLNSINWIQKGLEDLNLDDFKNIHTIIHLAATGVSPKKASIKDLEFLNVYQSLRLIQLAQKAGVKRFITVGTCLEYGKESDNWDYIPPNAKLEPLCTYSKSKAKCFELLSRFSIANNIEMFYGRIFSAYGEGQYEHNLWPSLVKAANSGNNFPMTTAEEIRDFIHVDEVTRYLLNAIYRKDIKRGEPLVVNIGSGKPIKLKDFAQSEWKKLKAEGKIIFGALKNRKYTIKRMVANLEGLNNDLSIIK